MCSFACDLNANCICTICRNKEFVLANKIFVLTQSQVYTSSSLQGKYSTFYYLKNACALVNYIFGFF